MKQIEIKLSKDECLQLRRGESIRVQFGDAILTITGEKSERIKYGNPNK
jgi:hypothetical protein